MKVLDALAVLSPLACVELRMIVQGMLRLNVGTFEDRVAATELRSSLKLMVMRDRNVCGLEWRGYLCKGMRLVRHAEKNTMNLSG